MAPFWCQPSQRAALRAAAAAAAASAKAICMRVCVLCYCSLQYDGVHREDEECVVHIRPAGGDGSSKRGHVDHLRLRHPGGVCRIWDHPDLQDALWLWLPGQPASCMRSWMRRDESYTRPSVPCAVMDAPPSSRSQPSLRVVGACQHERAAAAPSAFLYVPHLMSDLLDCPLILPTRESRRFRFSARVPPSPFRCAPHLDL